MATKGVRLVGLIALVWLSAVSARAQDSTNLLQQLLQQNELLRQQLQKQQQTIDDLNHRLSAVEADGYQRSPATAPAKETSTAFSLGKLIISSEGGVAFFESGRDGQFPNAEFRVDEAKLFLDAQIWDHTYFFAELNIAEREIGDTQLRVGELYVDIEDLGRWFGCDRALNLRVGRLDIPFGEEYLTRDVIDNVLISHSLSDLWGIDEGVELYGALGKFQYVLAVQNGGDGVADYNGDKAVVLRLGYDPMKQLHLSVSAMRTGNLGPSEDFVSAMWFGGGYFQALGAPATTTTFHAELLEGDVQLKLPRGHLAAAGGYARFDDNDTSADNKRDIYYYYIEGLYDITAKFYGAARFSQILASGGYPIVGQGDFADYFYGVLTKNIWRLSLGLGYRFSPQLVLKTEYSFERGTEVGGEKRDHEDQFGLELAYRF